jgi:hypothetical protein
MLIRGGVDDADDDAAADDDGSDAGSDGSDVIDGGGVPRLWRLLFDDADADADEDADAEPGDAKAS